MNVNIRKYSTILMLIMIAILSGCCLHDDSASQYYNSAEEFNKIYFKTVECIDLENTRESLERLQSEENRSNIEQLGTLVADIKNNIPKDREKLYNSFEQRYENLVFLKDSYNKLDSLDKDGRGRIDRIFILIGMDKANWKDKDSTIVWE